LINNSLVEVVNKCLCGGVGGGGIKNLSRGECFFFFFFFFKVQITIPMGFLSTYIGDVRNISC